MAGFLKKAGEYLLNAFSMGGYSAAKHLKDVPNAAQQVIGELNGSNAQARENAKQREWQTAENDKAAQYNLELAQMQNRWNIEQWQRENEYNSPSAQMARYGAAGLNPNLIYGQSNTAPQLSGSLTSGAPKSPAQGQFDTQIGQRSNLLNLAMQTEQLRGMRLDNDLRNENLTIRKFDTAFEDFISNKTFNPHDIETALNGKLSSRQRKYLLDLWKSSKDVANVDEDTKAKALDNKIKDESFDALVNKIESEADISNSNARYLAATFMARVNQVNYSNELALLQKEYQANKNEWMDFDRFAPIVLQSAEILGDFIGLKGFIKAIVGNRKPKFGKLKQKGDNTFEWE